MNLQGAERPPHLPFLSASPTQQAHLHYFQRSPRLLRPSLFLPGSEHRLHKAAGTELLRSRETPFPAQHREAEPRGGQAPTTGVDARDAPAAPRGTPATASTGRTRAPKAERTPLRKTKRGQLHLSLVRRTLRFTVPVGRRRG